MIPVVETPEIVSHYAPFFKAVFSPKAFEQFKRYISGLIVSENGSAKQVMLKRWRRINDNSLELR